MAPLSLWALDEALPTLEPLLDAFGRAGITVHSRTLGALQEPADALVVAPAAQLLHIRLSPAGEAPLLALVDLSAPSAEAARALRLADAVVGAAAPAAEWLLRIEEALRRAAQRRGRETAEFTGGPFTDRLPRERSGAGSAHPRLLVVEPDPLGRALLGEVLGRGYEVRAVATAAEALQSALSAPPDAILAALGLPDADGLGLLEALTGHPSLVDVPFLVASGSDSPALRVQALERGAADFLVKPLDLQELTVRLDRALKASQRLRSFRRQAETDALTGLANRRAFTARAAEEFQRASRHGVPLSVAALDLDNLKRLNDEQGHAAGDMSLTLLARLLLGHLRQTDFAARVGGDEFLLLLPHTAATDARVLAQRLLRASDQTSEHGVRARFSLGLATLQPGESIEQLVERADQALLEAKRLGRGRVCEAPGERTALQVV